LRGGPAACLLVLAVSSAHAVPVMDGLKDPEYTLVASSPKDNLLVNTSASPPIDDPADPRAMALDVTGLWAANTTTDLYLYIELPYLDLNAVAGEWAVVFHLKGANDSVGRVGASSDPYGAACDYAYSPPPNAVLKSNMCGFVNDYDGNQGYAFLCLANTAGTDWTWDNNGITGNAGWIFDTTNNLIGGANTGGGQVVYRGGKGIEVRIPLAMFGTGNSYATSMVKPSIGDVIQMQFYDNVRERGTPRYPRGPIDCVPFEAGSRTNPARGVLSSYASYTLRTPVTLDVTGAQIKDPTDAAHITVSFSSAVVTGGGVPAHFSVTNLATGTAIPVTGAAVEASDNTKVDIAVAVPMNSKLAVTVSNVQGSGGVLVTPTRNSATVSVGAPAYFNLYDPYGALSSLGNDPITGRPYKVVLTGSLISWRNDPDGASEIPVNAVAGEPGHYRTPMLVLNTGVVEYKYRVPHLANWDNWNVLNPNDREFYVPATSTPVQSSDNAANGTRNGGSVNVSFTLNDEDNIAAGRAVYVTGTWNNWSADPSIAVPMPAVSGQANTYRATLALPASSGTDVTLRYKYIIKPDPAGAPATTLWDDLNPLGDHCAVVRGTGGTAPQALTDLLGGSKFSRILRIASGLDTGPGWSAYFADLDINPDGKVDVMDVAAALRTEILPVTLPRLHTQGTQIVDPGGKPVTLRGINLGGWFVEEMWMTPWVQEPPTGSSYSEVVDHTTLWSTLTQRLGAASAQNVKNAYRSAWIEAADFRRIRAAGFNCVRLPFIYDIVDEPNGMDWLRTAVAGATSAGLYVILDMHGAPGSQNGWDHSGTQGPVLFFSNPANIAKAAQVWTSIAREFGQNPGVLGCDLLNEPVGAPDVATLNAAHNQLYQAVRAAAPDTIVIVEDGYKGFTTMPLTSQYGWTNVVYSTHLYDFNATSAQVHLDGLNAQLPAILQTRALRNVPVYVGEFNLEPNDSAAAMSQYTRTMTENGIAWTIWTYKTVATGGPMGFWGYYSNPQSVNPLDPFLDSEATLTAKLSQVRTENLTIPAGLAAVFAPNP
jgi:aryl-phospho-beta-D-glucosidase BglC (GH1 family)